LEEWKFEWLKCLLFKDLTRFNGFELLAWDFNPRWAMRSSIGTQIEFASSILQSRRVVPLILPQPFCHQFRLLLHPKNLNGVIGHLLPQTVDLLDRHSQRLSYSLLSLTL
jgi:hypothetical protein